MEYKTRKYYNLSTLIGANRGEMKGHKVLKLRFNVYDRDAKEQAKKYFTMFLSQENNDRNREILQHLGVEKPPAEVTLAAVENLNGLGARTVDLVTDTNDAGYENISFINEPRFGIKVHDL